LGNEPNAPVELTDSHIATILRIRLLVGFLGERAQFDWWPTTFFEPSSRLFLEPVFSKTARLAQYHAVLEAARRLHDEHLSVGNYHVFRLPEESEQDLHALALREMHGDLFGAAVQSKDAALKALRAEAGSKRHQGVGPVAIGKISDLASAGVLAAVAGIYLAAFEGQSKTYPYFLS
jgi:hypothetical protein